MTYRISASLADGWQYLMASDYADPQEFDARIKGKGETTPPMMLGREYAAALEGRYPDEDGVYYAPHHKFDVESMRAVYAEFNGGANEAKAEVTIDSRYGPLELVCRADKLHGLTVHEVKTKLGGFNAQTADRYLDSHQWKQSLFVFQCRRVSYWLTELKENRKTGVIETQRAIPISLFYYPSLEQDMMNTIYGLLDYAKSRGLLNYLKSEYILRDRSKETA